MSTGSILSRSRSVKPLHVVLLSIVVAGCGSTVLPRASAPSAHKEDAGGELSPTQVANNPVCGLPVPDESWRARWPKAPRLDPDDVGFTDRYEGKGWGNRCFEHLHNRRYSEGVAACQRGLKLATSKNIRGSLLYNLGLIARGYGDYNRARAYFRESLKVRPGNKTVKASLGAIDVSCHLEVKRLEPSKKTLGGWRELWKALHDEEERETFSLKVPTTETSARFELCHDGCRTDPPWVVETKMGSNIDFHLVTKRNDDSLVLVGKIGSASPVGRCAGGSNPVVCEHDPWHVGVHDEQNFAHIVENSEFDDGMFTTGSCKTGVVSYSHYFGEPSGGVVVIEAVWQGGAYLAPEATRHLLVERVGDEVTATGCGRSRTVKLRSR